MPIRNPEPSTHYIRVRVTKRQAKAIHWLAKHRKMNVSELIRSLVIPTITPFIP